MYPTLSEAPPGSAARSGGRAPEPGRAGERDDAALHGSVGVRDSVRMALVVAAASALGLLAGRTTVALWRFATAAPELPLWDEAKYGLDGVRLAAAVESLDLGRWIAIVYGLDVWPPLFPIVESLAFLAGGPSLAVARGLIATLFLFTVAAAFWAGREIVPESPAVAVAAAAPVMTSPFAQLFGAHVMLELPGALLLLLALAAYARSLRGVRSVAPGVDTSAPIEAPRPQAADAVPLGVTEIRPRPRGRSSALVVAGLLATALFFTKYNYAVLWIAPLLANEAWMASGGARAAAGRVHARARAIDLRRPWTLFVLLYALGLIAIAVTGGGAVRIGDTELRATSIGNPLYLLIVLAWIRAAATPRRSWQRWRRWVATLPPRPRALLWTTAVPAAVWLLLPPHLRSFVDFLDNRSSDLPRTAQTLLYHPRAFIEQYHASAPVGAVVLALALVALLRVARATPALRVVLLAAATGLAATAFHPYKEPRFFFVVAPLLWLAAAWNLTTVLESVAARVVSRLGGDASRAMRLGVNAAITVGVLVAAAAAAPLAPGLRAAFAGHSVPASTAPLLDRVVDLAQQQPTLVIGTWNQLSPMLVEWRFLERHADEAPPPPLPELVVPTSRRAAAAAEVARRFSGPAPPPRVASIELDGTAALSPEWARAYAAETAWLDALRSSLANGELPYAIASDEAFSETGYRLRVFRAVSPDSPVHPAE